METPTPRPPRGDHFLEEIIRAADCANRGVTNGEIGLFDEEGRIIRWPPERAIKDATRLIACPYVGDARAWFPEAEEDAK